MGADPEHRGVLAPGDATGHNEQEAHPHYAGQQTTAQQDGEDPPGPQAGEALATARLLGMPQTDHPGDGADREGGEQSTENPEEGRIGRGNHESVGGCGFSSLVAS